MLIIGHRGCDGYMENTINAFQYAVDCGCDMLEMDIQFTKDKQIIVFHDLNCERLLPIKGLIKNKTYDELKKYNISLLKNILDKFINIKLYIEFKNTFNSHFFNQTMKLLSNYNNKNIYLASFNYNYFVEFLNYKHLYKIGYITSNNLINIPKINNADFISINYELVDNTICNYFNTKNIDVYVFTINNKYILDDIIKYNINGIVTDKPLFIKEWIKNDF